MKKHPRIVKYFFQKLLKTYDSRAGNDGISFYNLNNDNVKNSRVLSNRESLIKKMPSSGIVAEIGVNKGKFSETILQLNNPEKLHLIDGWGSSRYNMNVEEHVRKRFAEQIEKNIVEINKGFSTNVLKNFSDCYFDWVYIDSDHGYKVTIEELNLLDEKVKKSGVIAGHDYCSRSRNKARKYGVIEAVHEFCMEKDYEFIFITLETNGHNSFAIKKIQ